MARSVAETTGVGRSRFAGRRIVVTGGGSGIGRADVLAMAREGGSIAVLDISEEGAARTIGLAGADGERCFFLPCDVTVEDQVGARISEAAARLGGLDVLVSNTGVVHVDTAEATALADWHRMLALNLTSAWLCARAAIPIMREGGGGAIVSMSSGSGFRPRAGVAAYAAAKAGIITLTRSLAKEHAADNIRANCVAPIATPTPLLEHMLVRFSEGRDRAEVEQAILNAIPMKRFATAEEIAAAVLFLASDEASAITGHCLVVDCGAFA